MVRNFWVCGLSEPKRDVFWSGIFRVGTSNSKSVNWRHKTVLCYGQNWGVLWLEIFRVNCSQNDLAFVMPNCPFWLYSATQFANRSYPRTVPVSGPGDFFLKARFRDLGKVPGGVAKLSKLSLHVQVSLFGLHVKPFLFASAHNQLDDIISKVYVKRRRLRGKQRVRLPTNLGARL